MDTAEKVREDRVRRMLSRQGYTLTRSRRRDPRAADFGRYAIMDWKRGIFVAGADDSNPPQYGMTLDEAERWALEGERPVQDWEEIDATVAAAWLSEIASTGGDGPYPLKVLRGADGETLIIKPDLAMRYLAKLPAPADIPAGKVVVHNHVYPVSRRPGDRGSRCWLADPGAKLAVCSCGWAPELGTHYSVAAIG